MPSSPAPPSFLSRALSSSARLKDLAEVGSPDHGAPLACHRQEAMGLPTGSLLHDEERLHLQAEAVDGREPVDEEREAPRQVPR